MVVLLYLTLTSASAAITDSLVLFFNSLIPSAKQLKVAQRPHCENFTAVNYKSIAVLPELGVTLVSASPVATEKISEQLTTLGCPLVEMTNDGPRCVEVGNCEMIGNFTSEPLPLTFTFLGVLLTSAVFWKFRSRKIAEISDHLEDFEIVDGVVEEEVYLREILEFCGERKVFARRLSDRLSTLLSH